MSHSAPLSSREWFTAAALAWLEVVATIRDDDWAHDALGEWTVRDLVGHTSRSFLTIEAYVRTDPGGSDVAAAMDLADPEAYYVVAMGSITDPDEVAERGRAAGRALGEDPITAVHAIAGRVIALVDGLPDEARVVTPWGAIALIDYLPTRAFELTVHGVDLVQALEARTTMPDRTIGAALHLAVDLAVRGGQATALLLALTGRQSLPTGFSVL